MNKTYTIFSLVLVLVCSLFVYISYQRARCYPVKLTKSQIGDVFVRSNLGAMIYCKGSDFVIQNY